MILTESVLAELCALMLRSEGFAVSARGSKRRWHRHLGGGEWSGMRYLPGGPHHPNGDHSADKEAILEIRRILTSVADKYAETRQQRRWLESARLIFAIERLAMRDPRLDFEIRQSKTPWAHYSTYEPVDEFDRLSLEMGEYLQ